jgi:hypothetical protein
MSLLPRRGPGRHGRPDGVAVHPGWTLSPTSVTETPAYQPEHVRDTVAQQPQSRWTSTPAVPAIPATPEPAPQPEPAPVAVVVPAVVEQPAPAAAGPGWASEWEAVAATPTSPGAPLALHTDAVAALDAVFGANSALAAWTAAPADLEQAPHPAPRPTPALTELDLPLTVVDRETSTPLAVEAARAIPAVPAPIAVPAAIAAPAPNPAPASTPPPPAVLPQPPLVAPPVLAFVRPAPPTTWPSAPSLPPPAPAPRGSALPSAARQLLEQAIRTAPSAPAQRRSTVRLGFADASVIDLRPDDPIAKALHTVADALIGRDRR